MGFMPRKVVLAVIMSARGFRLFMIPGSWGAVPVISGIRKLQKKTRHIGGVEAFPGRMASLDRTCGRSGCHEVQV